MQQGYNDKKNEDKKDSPSGKILPQQRNEDFNTDSDKPSSNVGPGYDDTGSGNDVRSTLNDQPGDLTRRRHRKKIQKKKD